MEEFEIEGASGSARARACGSRACGAMVPDHEQGEDVTLGYGQSWHARRGLPAT